MSVTVHAHDDLTVGSTRPVKPSRAILSVSDKTGLVAFAQRLAAAGVELFSTGGTRRTLAASECTVRDVADYTGFPEMMDGRLKTLHPKIFGGILARRDRSEDMDSLSQHAISSFDLVVVNLYPFERTVAAEGVTDAEAIEQIDIGGPSLIRAAAKNFADVAVVTDSSQYELIVQELEAEGTLSLATRRRLAAAAFARTAEYDRAIADYFARAETFPASLGRVWSLQTQLRYGENPHQQAALYADPSNRGPSLVAASQLHGKGLSYNNYLDLDAAWSIVREQPRPSVAVIKHNNPCGAATGDVLAAVARRALEGDPVSAFGSVLGINRAVDEETAEVLATPGLFIEAIVAPSFDEAALQVLTTKPKWKGNVRLLAYGDADPPSQATEVRPIDGGALVQDSDHRDSSEREWKVVTERVPEAAELVDLRFAWDLVRHVRSNAIVMVRDQAVWGVGAGQMSRVDAVEIAIKKAGDRAVRSVLASDAFFPFPDSVQCAAAAGITALIQPGGSRRDDEVIAEANRLNLAMIFTGRRHFKH